MLFYFFCLMHPCDRLRTLLIPWKPNDLITAILTKRDIQGSVNLGYLYSANISGRKLLTDHNTMYRSALEALDYIGVDGIGLQMILWLDSLLIQKKRPQRYPNCNGTDLLPLLLHQASQYYTSLGLILYGSTPEQIIKTQQFLETKGYTVIYAQDGYRDFDRTAYDQAIHHYPHHKIIMIVGRSSITHAIQEERRYTNRDKCQTRMLCVCLQGGIFEHSSMGGKEKRAPYRVQSIKAERIRRLCINPRKNAKKVRYAAKIFVDWFYARLSTKK